MSADISIIAREYCQRSRLIRKALVAARLTDSIDTRPIFATPIADPRSRFAAAVLDRLDGPILRYSMRLELLDIARSLRLSRFDACLIIAQVQHRAPGRLKADDVPARSEITPQTSRLPRLAPYLVAVIIQLSIVAGAWSIFS